MEYLHYFETTSAFETARSGDYKEPWVSYTVGKGLDFNKSRLEKLIGEPLTFEILSSTEYTKLELVDGEGVPSNPGSDFDIYYKINDGEWTLYNQPFNQNSYNYPGLSVQQGDKIQWKGDNLDYDNFGLTFSLVDNGYGSSCTIYGNPMSLIDSQGFATAQGFPAGTENWVIKSGYIFNRCAENDNFSYSNYPNIVFPFEIIIDT